MEEDRFKHRGRPKVALDSDLRHLIVQVAGRLFLQKGYGATTTEEIAVCCKISKQTLYRLFAGKSALFAAIVERKRLQWLELPVPDDLPLQTALERIFRMSMSEDEEHERIQFLQMVMTEGRLYPELAEILNNFGSARMHVELAGWLQLQADKGLIKLVEDALTTSYLLTDMVFGSLLRKTIGSMQWRRGEAWRAHVRAAIGVFLYGTSCQPVG